MLQLAKLLRNIKVQVYNLVLSYTGKKYSHICLLLSTSNTHWLEVHMWFFGMPTMILLNTLSVMSQPQGSEIASEEEVPCVASPELTVASQQEMSCSLVQIHSQQLVQMHPHPPALIQR